VIPHRFAEEQGLHFYIQPYPGAMGFSNECSW